MRFPRPVCAPAPAATLVIAATLAFGAAGCSSSDNATVESPAATRSQAAPGSTAGSSPTGAVASATDVITPGAAGSGTTETASTTLTYAGEDGKTALELLRKADPSADWTGSGKNAFVVEINGRPAQESKHEFWALYVNGKQAQVGAGSLATKDGDTIQWKLETY